MSVDKLIYQVLYMNLKIDINFNFISNKTTWYFCTNETSNIIDTIFIRTQIRNHFPLLKKNCEKKRK